jgi:predicted small secreted protein
MKKLMFILACLALITSLVGCNAYKGLGKDVENTGENIQGN